jgi:hypothetical protein
MADENRPATPEAPRTLDDVILGLKGFGIEENEEILTFEASGKTVSLRISNIPTESELSALLAAEEFKGYAWVQRIRCELLSRAVTWVNGMSIRDLPEEGRIVTDPTSRDGARADIQVVLRNIFLGWGQETVITLWKMLMVHSDKIEKRMKASFPESTLMTEVERRFFDAAMKEIHDATKEVIEDTVARTMEDELPPEDRKELDGVKAEAARKA